MLITPCVNGDGGLVVGSPSRRSVTVSSAIACVSALSTSSRRSPGNTRQLTAAESLRGATV